MRRRKFITLLGGAVASPLPALAQSPTMPRIGLLITASLDLYTDNVSAFRRGLSEAGYDEGRNVAIEYRSATNENDQISAVSDLIRHQVAVIAMGGTAAALAAKAANTTTPVVFYVAVDPVEVGLVTSLARPGGNLTGVTSLSVELGPKQLELLHELVPKATSVALLVTPSNRTLAETLSKDVQTAARTLGLQIHVLRATAENDFETVFATLARLQVGGLIIAPDAFFTSHSEQLAALSARQSLPTIYQFRQFPAAGGLMSYGGSNENFYHQVGIYTGRILGGEKPADLPVQQSTKFELIINVKTAKALGITIPLSLLGRADEIIE